MKIAVLVHGCGAQDGTEIHEAVLSILALQNEGFETQVVSPFGSQYRVVNHLTRQVETSETRLMQAEAARIGRGHVQDITTIRSSDYSGLVIPGGTGTAYNICDFATLGSEMSVDSRVVELIQQFYLAKKPIAAICIAPVLIAKVLGQYGVEVTIGNDVETAAAIERMGARHVACRVDGAHVDPKHRIVTTPAYMLAKNLSELNQGITKCIQQFRMMAQ